MCLQSLQSSTRREWPEMQMSRYPLPILLLCNTASVPEVPRNREAFTQKVFTEQPLLDERSAGRTWGWGTVVCSGV